MNAEPNIIEKIESYLNTYMVFPDPAQARTVALWVLHTWTFSESFPFSPMATPYLYINSETPRSGKTLLIDLLEPIVLNPERGADMTGSVMFRLIEKIRPTLFVDEVDTLFQQGGAKNEPMRNVLNSGYKWSGYTWRNVGGEPEKFKTFCAKLLAGINNGKLPETVETRSIFINLRRVTSVNAEGEIVAPDGSTREIYYAFMAEEAADQLVKDIQAFMAGWIAHYQRYTPKPIAGMEPRQWEIAFPLVQVAHEVDRQTGRTGIEDAIREMLKVIIAPRQDKEKPEVALLRAIKKAFDDEKTDRLFTETLCAYLGEGWNGKRLGPALRKLGVGPSTTLTIKNRTLKGYIKAQFAQAWEDYLA